jgi:hypothetical protein
MSIPRPIEQQIFPDVLQAHSLMPTGLNLADPQVFNRFLREEALISRGLVVVDSDLNNNKIFHKAAEHDEGLFWAAIRNGFIRRAARKDDAENLLTQREIAEGLKRSAPQRFEQIPVDYLAKLDVALASAEAVSPPLIWTPKDVYASFTGRLSAMLESSAADATRDSAQRDMVVAIRDWVSDQLAEGNRVGSAEIESRFEPPPGSTEFPAWNAVWRLILDAQTGNIPPVFRGDLTVRGLTGASDRMLPGGPEASPEEKAVQAQIYAHDYAERSIDFEVRHTATTLPDFRPNWKRLDELSLEQVEELRDAAEPGERLIKLFEARGSAEAMAATQAALRDATAGYLDRLASAGDLLIRQTLRAQTDAQIVAIVGSLDRAVEYTMVNCLPWPEEGPQVVMCDYTSLVSEIGMERAREFARGEAKLKWVYKRPDYRVIERVARA